MKRLFLLLVLFSLMGSVSAYSSNVITNAPYQSKRVDVLFPTKIALFEKIGHTNYDDERLGVSIRYQHGANIKTDIYVYDLGITNLSNGASSIYVKNEMKGCKDNILKMEKRGYYRNVQHLEDNAGAFEGKTKKIGFIFSMFSYSQNRKGNVNHTEPRISHIILTTYQKHFLKIRCTYPAKGKEQHFKQMIKFLDEFEELLKIE